MRAVMGIDAAWTETQPSGVALAVESDAGWRLAAVESFYDRFVALAGEAHPPDARPLGSRPVAATLLGAALKIGGRQVELIAVDMPLGPDPIAGRRKCDDDVSCVYGARKAAVHSPGRERPGEVSDSFRAAFAALGYPLCVRRLRAALSRSILTRR